MLITLTITVVVLGLGFLHTRLSRLRSPWFGAIFPALWLVTVVALLATGRLDSGIAWAGVLVVMVTLLRLWGQGREAVAEPQPEPALRET